MIPNEVRDIIKSSKSRIPISTYETKTIETWRWRGKPRGSDGELVPLESLELWKAIGSWRNNSPPWLYLYGVPGVGKTHMALALAWNDIVGIPGSQVLFFQVESLMDQIRAGFESGESNELLKDIKNCYLLILDDIGAQKLTEWSVAKLDSIVDHRYIENKETIFTSNYSLSGKYNDRIPPRIADRIKEGVVARVNGESARGHYDNKRVI